MCRCTKMDHTAFAVPTLFFLFLSLTCFVAGEPDAVSCPEYQGSFDGSCYEFVGLQRPFLGAQKWCERGGGHVAFILNDETQKFLQTHLDPKKDWWLGLAPAAPNLTLDTAATQVSLAWLNGSDVSYNNWASKPDAQATCGHILKKSGFRWVASENCTQELSFICQFESRRSFACDGQNVTLQCGSGQVIEIDHSFYGRKTIHYCRTKLATTPSPLQEECTWTDVADSVKGSCHGLQACQASADAKSYGEPCPLLGSYLSVEYRCKDGLHLLMSKLAAVFDNVTFNIKWLLQPYEGNLTCALNAGDGYTIDSITPEEMETTVMHTFKTPGLFVVTVECSTSDWHVTAQKSISIQEPVGQFGAIKCYSINTSEGGTNCSLLYIGGPVDVQVTVETGTNVSYILQHKDLLLANSSADRGITPHNITLNASAVEQLGHGCNNLTLNASNNVTSQIVSTQFELCLLEPVEGLQASVIAEDDRCPDSSDLIIGVSLERGAPVQLLFTLTFNNVTRLETRNMLNGSLQMYTFGSPVEGSFQLNVQAANALSTSDFNVSLESIFLACENHSDSENMMTGKSYDLKIISTPESVVDNTENVTLSINGSVSLPSKGLEFKWKCRGDCKCKNQTNGTTYMIDKQCLPNPFEMAVYSVTVKKNAWFRKWVKLASASKCITVAQEELKNVSISCDNCTSIDANDPVKLRLSCVASCPDVDWYIEDLKPLKQDNLETCFSQEGRRPLMKKQEGNSEFLVNSKELKYSRDNLLNITVIAQGKSEQGYARYTLPIPDPEPTVTPSHPTCSIFPLSGTVLDSFDITCQASSFCSSGCLYCFKTDTGKHLRCSNKEFVKSILLPVGDEKNNYNLSVVITVKNEYTEVTTIVHTQVRKNNSSGSVDTLQSVLEDTVSHLEQDGLLSGEALSQIVTSVADMLNTEADEDQKDARTKLREQMLTKMTTVLLDSPSNTSYEVQVTARAVAELTQRSDELSPAAQEEASSLLVDLSSSLNIISVHQDGSGDDGEVVDGAAPIVEAASNILNAPSNEKVSTSLLTGMGNVQNALLNHKKLNGDPIIIDSNQISVYVNRVSPESMQMQDINIQRSSASRFSFPTLPPDVFSPDEPVDVRMMSFEKNPYSWKGGNISGTVGSVSLTRPNGTVIPIKNLPEEIEILLPRPDVGQENSTVLDLANFSTLIIDVPSPDVTLVLKMEPSENITFVLLLGHKNYPTIEHFVAKTQMPLENVKEEEKYTWVLSPKDRTGDAGVHFLVLKPKVEPGVKSVNATVSIVTIAAQCKYWDEEQSSWSEDGCRVGPLTTPLLTQCLCNHLTFFGSSFFVMPNLVDVSRTAELFSTFFNNPVVVCFVGAIFCSYLLVVVWARRKDIQDSAKVKITVLEDNDPLAEYCYMLTIGTGHRHGASTSSQVTITLLGTEGESEPHHLTDLEKPLFERGAEDVFLLTTHFSLGELQSVRLWHDNSGAHPAWYVNKVMVQDLESGQKWHFLCNSWLAVDVGECNLDKVFPVATEEDLKRFSNLFFMKTAKDFRDGHIWFSVISRPPCSTFTRVQRVSCCFSLLLCTMLTSIMFWGIPTDPSEQTMDLGHIEFTWQQVMIGIQSSIIMFPINLLIVSIFRNTRPREKSQKSDKTKQGKTVRVSPSQTSSPQKEQKYITPDTVLKDIKRIAQSLSKAMKSPLPYLELRPGHQTDINTLLSLVEDIIRQQNRISSDFYTDTTKRERSILSLGAVDLQEKSVWGSPERTLDGVQKKSNNSRYLYRQLRHVEKKLGFLGSSRFQNPDSYNKAMQQVQGMKNLLEFHLPSHSLDGEQSERSPSPEESANKGTAKRCYHGGLPWWFVFVGWILVIATSGVSGYFTMMYGLTYGKDRSISWLISMVVSFFESLFITQPLKVLGFAAFFALVLKKVDQEEYGEPQIDESLKNYDDPDGVRAARRDSTCSFYQPPPPTDIEKMRNNMIKEQKVFALIREILAYMGFMWMLLLVAYGQRDPNAYFLTQHIRQSFSKGISDTMSIQDVFNWANTTLLSNLFGEHPGFITDGNSKLVGNARLRQLRVQKNSCRVARRMEHAVHDCHSLYSWESEDMGSYSPGWSSSEPDNTSVNLPSPWKYQSQGKLRAYPIWGSMILYRGGGFVVDLGPDLENSSRSLQYLYENRWFDAHTQAIFVEFTVYNANVNLFCIVTLMLETTALGAFQFCSELQNVRLYQSTGGLHIFVMASEAIYFLFILYYMFVQAKLMKQQRWAYFKSKLNLLELAIILLSWSALSVFIKRTLLGKRDMEYYQNHKDQFASFHETAKADAVLGYLIAFLVLLATVKLWHLLRLNPKLHMITATLQRAWTDISGFLVVMTIMFLAYSIASNLMYGWKLYSYRTLFDAAQTMVSLQLGIFNYDEILSYNPILGAFLIGSCIVFMTFVVLNLFISVILVAFSQEQIHHKPSEEEEIVDMMMMKFCSLFGIKSKTKQDDDGQTEKAQLTCASNNEIATILPGRIDKDSYVLL